MELGELVDKYLDQIKGDFSNRTLARKIIEENPGLFLTSTQAARDKEIERVRRAIRYRRGAVGKENMKYAESSGALRKEFVRDEMKPSEYMREYMQKGDSMAHPIWHLPKHFKKVLVLSDIHIPYHTLEAIETALDYGFNQGIDCIYLNGDVIDFAKISRWAKDPLMKTAAVEVAEARLFLEGLISLGLPVFYKLGNHEDRWNRYIIDNAPELYDLDVLQIRKVLHLDALGIELIDSRQRAKFGKLNVIHGHEFGKSVFSPVNPARGLFLRAKASILAGHFHQTSAHHENDINGKQTACFSSGCLCDLQPDYRPFAFTKWNHGAAIVELNEDGNFSVDNFRIIEGKVY